MNHLVKTSSTEIRMI